MEQTEKKAEALALQFSSLQSASRTASDSTASDSTSSEKKQEKEAPMIRLYLDFDGTLTGLDGQHTIGATQFYRSLLKDPSKLQDYDKLSTEFHKEEVLVALMKHHFDSYNPSQNPIERKMRMQNSAFAFVKTMLEKHPKVQINIISRNREEYIRAMFLYMGLKPEDLANIHIYGVNKLLDVEHSKRATVSQLEERYKGQPKAKLGACFDDDETDSKGMADALTASSHFENVLYLNNPVGGFNWKAAEAQIVHHLAESPNPT